MEVDEEDEKTTSTSPKSATTSFSYYKHLFSDELDKSMMLNDFSSWSTEDQAFHYLSPPLESELTTTTTGAHSPPPPLPPPPPHKLSDDVSSSSGDSAAAVPPSFSPLNDANSTADTSSKKKSSSSSSGSKKKGPKRCRQPRVAFMTKSEVDHLEDGYRWRKYGQKAVKNSPFPRSYYRCTNSKCQVKKRVERSSSDPSIVITTYEGQHCHHTVAFTRAGSTSYGAHSFTQPLYTSFPAMQAHLINAPPFFTARLPTHTPPPLATSTHLRPLQASATSPPSHLPTDDGLLDDIVPAKMHNR